MAVRGAIFDCDGTLLDSMPMWTRTCVELLERHGVEDARRVFAERESLDMDEKCYWYHDNLGIGQSGEALYRELWDMVVAAYRTSVRPFEGCKAFLDELKDAGVPMVVASATPTELLREALQTHGLLGYFDSLVFAGDVGRGKEHPDVYLAARRQLGTPREQTWVFEDAPFGVRSAARAGFPVAAILNDHDGRDEGFLGHWATVVAHGYAGLSIAALEGLAPASMDALVVAGSPDPSSAELVAGLAAKADLVVAADRGVRALMEAGIVPDVFCGDQDSAGDDAVAWAASRCSRVVRYPVEKDDTDLELAIGLVREEAEARGCHARLVLTCATGGRPDHMLGVWGVLARNADLGPALAEDGFECRILSPAGEGSWRIDAPRGSTVSVLSLVGDAVVSERGMRWPLDHEPLAALDDRGVSNRVTGGDVVVTCHEGVVAVLLFAS